MVRAGIQSKMNQRVSDGCAQKGDVFLVAEVFPHNNLSLKDYVRIQGAEDITFKMYLLSRLQVTVGVNSRASGL